MRVSDKDLLGIYVGKAQLFRRLSVLWLELTAAIHTTKTAIFCALLRTNGGDGVML
jgi:hypothetical protein